MCDAASIELPPWAQVSAARREHIARVTSLLVAWSVALGMPAPACAAWRDAGLWHDALRDASEPDLRAWSGEPALPVGLLHGPAAANRLAQMGETRSEVLDAIRWHTIGSDAWGRTGRALYMADYLEPGRKFSRADRAYLASQVPRDFDGTFRQVVRHRLEWSLREGHELYPTAVAMWNGVR
ncbi:MAG TPA: hypothetical protein VIC24_00570 [Gemmatimonadaceae bacterium]|jgi:2-amino-4-hydroxy-6-hydroxymethyldihydropteridine diphosphokinase